MEQTEFEQVLEDLEEVLSEDELNDLLLFINDYLEDENNPRSLIYILNQLKELNVIPKANKAGKPIKQLLELVLAKVDVNVDEETTDNSILSLIIKSGKSGDFEGYCEEVINPVIEDVLSDIEMSDDNFYDKEGSPRIRHIDD